MRGELVSVWTETWREIWLPLSESPLGADDEFPPSDIFCELYRTLEPAFSPRITIEDLADIIDDPLQSREAFASVSADEIANERSLASFFENAFDTLDELGGEDLTNHYFKLLSNFVKKFSLRYDLRRPCVLCPTLPGVFTSLVDELRAHTKQDLHLDALMEDFEEAMRDLRYDISEGRIKTCIQKQVNLLEAVGRAAPGMTETTLGAICNQVGTWPHKKVKEAIKSLYVFTSDYPGIRHGGTPASEIRALDMRDLIAISVLLTGFTPYLESRLNADAIFGGSSNRAGLIPPSAALANRTVGLRSSESVIRRLWNSVAFWISRK